MSTGGLARRVGPSCLSVGGCTSSVAPRQRDRRNIKGVDDRVGA